MNFDRNKCAARNRIAARRDGVNSTPVQFFRADALPPLPGEDLGSSWGKLPKGDAAALEAINRRCLSGRTLAADDVWWRYMEAANSSFIDDRYMFLDASTLKNIAKDAEAGFAFMNSHRTGSMSHPTELPFGWTFAGRYEETDGQHRTLLGVYMVLTNDKGEDIRPNGDSGPSSRDLAAMIDAGSTPDVSVGLRGGSAICDVCGEPIDYYGDGECEHYPGTTYGMTTAQQKAQKDRGVPDGCCSYSLVNARCGEVSSVYDGAVPGAGFRKALSLCRQGGFNAETRQQLQHAYGRLLRNDDFSTGEPSPRAGQTFADQSESVLAAVDDWLTRAESVSALREGEGRRLSSERLAELQGFIDRAQALVTANRRSDLSARLRALRLSQLAQQAGITV